MDPARSEHRLHTVCFTGRYQPTSHSEQGWQPTPKATVSRQACSTPQRLTLEVQSYLYTASNSPLWAVSERETGACTLCRNVRTSAVQSAWCKIGPCQSLVVSHLLLGRGSRLGSTLLVYVQPHASRAARCPSCPLSLLKKARLKSAKPCGCKQTPCIPQKEQGSKGWHVVHGAIILSPPTMPELDGQNTQPTPTSKTAGLRASSVRRRLLCRSVQA